MVRLETWNSRALNWQQVKARVFIKRALKKTHFWKISFSNWPGGKYE